MLVYCYQLILLQMRLHDDFSYVCMHVDTTFDKLQFDILQSELPEIVSFIYVAQF